MQDRLNTARELLDDIGNLSLDERHELWDLLKFVMSDPKCEWVPAKTKVIGIKLAKVNKSSREFLLDFTAKVAAQVIKLTCPPRTSPVESNAPPPENRSCSASANAGTTISDGS